MNQTQSKDRRSWLLSIAAARRAGAMAKKVKMVQGKGKARGGVATTAPYTISPEKCEIGSTGRQAGSSIDTHPSFLI